MTAPTVPSTLLDALDTVLSLCPSGTFWSFAPFPSPRPSLRGRGAPSGWCGTPPTHCNT
ncbi:hypothetical protein OAK48_01675 [Deltaproteobacteria bacterium]|nr:hypothetical protein [Deltaproteobacteria bacterium]